MRGVDVTSSLLVAASMMDLDDEPSIQLSDRCSQRREVQRQ